jgi:hypothetical protein
MGEEGTSDRNHRLGMTRRDLIRKGAIVGGLVWSAPVIQSITTPASANGVVNGSQSCESCCCCFTGVGQFQCSNDHFTQATCEAHCRDAGSRFLNFCSGTSAGFGGGGCACLGPAC